MSSHAEQVRVAANEQIAQRDADITRYRKRLAEVQGEQKAFKKTLAGTGYRSDAEYRRANDLADKVWHLKRSIKECQVSKRNWRSAITRASR